MEVSLPLSTTTGSSQYRSVNDPTLEVHKVFLLIDTPGHGKLRHHVTDNITKPQNLKGVIFVVDAASLSAESGLRECAEYLHDLLLLLQKRASLGKSSKTPGELPVLVAANKLDLFAALPAAMVKTRLEAEITKVRISRSKGLLDSGISMGDSENLEERDWLGEGGEGPFNFKQMEEFNIEVEVVGGNAASLGPEKPDVGRWWAWIGSKL